MTPASPPCHALVVHIDDNDGDRDLVRLAVEDCCGPEADYRGAENGGQGLDLLRALLRPGSPAITLIIVDVNLPGIDGWQIVALIKEQPKLRAVPLMMLSGSSSAQDIVRAKQAGVTFRTKPPTFSGLSQMICDFLTLGGGHG